MPEPAAELAEEHDPDDCDAQRVADVLDVASTPEVAPARAGSRPASSSVASGVIPRPIPPPISSSPGTSAAIEPPVPIDPTVSSSAMCPQTSSPAPAASTRRPWRTVSSGARSEVAR